MSEEIPSRKFHSPVAYKDESFLESNAARSVRILSEYLGPLDKFRKEMIRDTVVFFGSARIPAEGGHPLVRYYQDARTLARKITEWSDSLSKPLRFVVTTGGGPGIMEAANRGAHDANGKSIGLNIGLPFEQWPNPYITPELSFEFHYFFMRKFWFAYLAKALVVFPGGFGTLDELSELLTLTQTHKLEKKMIIILYGSKFWNEVINFEALARYGMISESDLDLFQFADDPDEALTLLVDGLTQHYLEPREPLPAFEQMIPAISKSRL
ncbi:MAG: LOG family protein [Acidobacteria bacterium]|nr:LOG family protein [Acidobacteriota bacterium]